MANIFINRRLPKRNFLLLILFSLILSGCGIFTRFEQPVVTNSDTLSAEQTIGQTFVAKYAGLNGIYFYIIPAEVGDGEIQLHLRSGPQAENDLATSLNTINVKGVKVPGYYGFIIPSQLESYQKYYYAYLELTGNGKVQVGKSEGNSYINGSLYQNGNPVDFQTAFQLRYSWRWAVLGLGREAITWLGILAIACFLFILPGWGLFSLLWPRWGRLIWPEKLGLSAGVGLAVYPILFLITYLIGLHLGAIYAWLPGLAGLGMIIWRNRKRFKSSELKLIRLHLFKLPNQIIWPDIVFLIILALVVFTRFWAIRSLELPLGADSYQHTMIAQLLVDHGGLFKSWQPYTDLTTFTYHFGFHTAVAVFYWLTQLEMYKAVLWVGQLMNILAVIALYPLAMKVGRSRWAGVAAVIVAGLLSSMPMYYVNWGRYTQLAGQVILPVVAWLMWTTLIPDPAASLQETTKKRKAAFGELFIVSVALGGQALTHYRVLILAVLFLVVLWMLYVRRDNFRPVFMKTLWIGVGAGLLFLPWFIRVFSGRIMQIFASKMAIAANRAAEADVNYSGATSISFYLPYLLWLALIVIFGIGAWRRDKGIILISLWWFVNFLAGNPSWLGLPGSGALSSNAIFLAMYIPASILVGALVAWVEGSITWAFSERAWIRKGFSPGIAILLVFVSLWGAFLRRNDLHADVSIATRPDIQASAWIQQNIPTTARFLVESFPLFNNNNIAGSDGGYWLPLLARRQTTNPPLNYGSEKDPWPGYLQQTNALTLEIQSKGIQNPEVLTQLKKEGITYIYVGERQGQVGPGPLYNVNQLLADPNYHPIYHQDRVWIFQIQPTP